MDERGDALRMLGVSKTFEEPIRGVQDGKGHLWPVDQRGKAPTVAFARFAKEHGFDAAARTKRFFDETQAFDADRARLRGKASAQRHTKFLEPPIVAAGKNSGRGCGRRGTGGFAWSGHYPERSKFRVLEANRLNGWKGPRTIAPKRTAEEKTEAATSKVRLYTDLAAESTGSSRRDSVAATKRAWIPASNSKERRRAA